MTVSGITIIRNGIKFDYPFIESINSILPVCDEFIVVAGKSDDGTREKIAQLGSPKIKIIDTIWDESLREGGKILAQQTNIGLDHASGDWCFYLQADEVAHEKDHQLIVDEMKKNLNNPRVDGLLFSYYHFWGYRHVCVTRRTYRREIRIVRNDRRIRSYKDAQGFRKFSTPASSGSEPKGAKLNVRFIDAHIYAYSRVRTPEMELHKVREFERLWHTDEFVNKKYADKRVFDYQQVDMVMPFDASGHPHVMRQRAENSAWQFEFNGPRFSLKNRLLYEFEKRTGWRIGENRNYRIISK